MSADADQIKRMEELQVTLKEAADAYYNRDIEIMSNYEYDALYDELLALEEETGIVLEDSITQGVGAEVVSELPKVEHSEPMLSLGKTKSRDELVSWLGEREGCLSYKLDGSTVVLTYDGGKLVQAVTRGNGRIGEDITPQARKFAYVPHKISFAEHLIVRGEALMTYSEFNRVNDLQDEGNKYKNPRNLASGTMRALDTSVLDERTVEFHPFTLVEAEGKDENSYTAQLDWLASLGFSPVEHWKVTADELTDKIAEIEATMTGNDFPSDGLVLFFDDVAYGDSLGATGHHPRNGIAFKWADESASTSLIEIKWQTSRTGRINPVAVFEPIEIDGTTVERATLNNLTFMEDLLGKPYVGQDLSVIKANLIIPTIIEAAKGEDPLPEDVEEIGIPKACPVCGSPTHRKNDHGSEFLYCDNEECPSRQKGVFAHFVSRDAMNIMGLSKEKLEALMTAGVVTSFADIMKVGEHEGEIVLTIREEGKKDKYVGLINGFKKKSFDNLVKAVEKARHTEAARFLYALGIREIGRTASRDICKAYGNDLDKIITDAAANKTATFTAIDGIGEIMASELCSYMAKNETMVRELLELVEITDGGEVAEASENDFVTDKTFVITGEVNQFKNRNEFKAFVEANGGRVAGSVSKNTDYLVTNTPDSGTSKNRKAQELGVAIITEAEFCERAGR